MEIAKILKIISRYYFRFYLKTKGISNAKDIKVKGKPIIEGKGKLILKKGVTLNSSNRKYHINMHSPVKLFSEDHNSYIEIGENSRIHGTCIHARSKITIGKNCLIAANTHIIDSNGHPLYPNPIELRLTSMDIPKEISIGDNVWIAANCMILAGTEIGKNSVIGANSVLKGSFPSDSFIAGNPARVIKNLDHSEK